MEELKVSYTGVDIQIITQDLSSQDGTKNLCRLIDDAGLQVDILVNNAATALSEPFMDSSIENIERLTTLNMTTTATRLVHHFLPGYDTTSIRSNTKCCIHGLFSPSAIHGSVCRNQGLSFFSN